MAKLALSLPATRSTFGVMVGVDRKGICILRHNAPFDVNVGFLQFFFGWRALCASIITYDQQVGYRSKHIGARA